MTGPATAASLGSVSGITVDQAGNVFFASSGYTAVFRLDASGVLTLVAGTGTEGFSGDNGPATRARISNYGQIAMDASGNLYIADGSNNRIRKVSNGVITTVAGNGTRGFSGDNGPAISAQLASPGGIALDAAGDLYIAETLSHRIRKVTHGVITTIATGGTAEYCFCPHGIAVDAVGSLYFANVTNNRILKVSDGTITTVAGKGTAGFSGDNGAAASAELDSPAAVAVDASGNLYIADSENYRIRKVSNGVITTVAGNGMEALSESAALLAPLPDETIDAYSLLLGKYSDGFIPGMAVNTILGELRAIRTAAPEVAEVHDSGPFDLREILVHDVAGLRPASRSGHQRETMIHRMALNPLATGIPGLDELNKKFGAIKIEDNYGYLMIRFSRPIDIGRVVEFYRSRLGSHFQPNHVVGDGDHIQRIQRAGLPVHYVFTIGSGDCPAGCIEHAYYHFNIYPQGRGFRVEKTHEKPADSARGSRGSPQH